MNAPLLHSAGRALNLPARSQQTFQAAFGLSLPPSSSSSSPAPPPNSSRSSKSAVNGSSSQAESIGPVDPMYTGHILVSGYHVSFVLPKILPPRYPEDGSGTNSVRASGKYGGRRLSIGDRDRLQAQFVAAIELWVPFVSQPPRSPFLLSIPTPRCLHNNIKLRIFPPNTNTTSASLASLSSLDDDSAGSWDLASDPHVTRAATSPRSRASSNGYGHNSYHGNEADDESSDSSTAGFSYGCGIQGSFPSTERIRMRWAKPVKNLDIPRYGYGRDNLEISTASIDTGRRRVGVKSAKGEMTCIVKGKARSSDGAEGIIMDVEYKGTCKDVWYPGVATLLGMDVSLEAKNSDVSWLQGEGSPGSGWEVTGGSGYTGFDAGNDSNPRATGGRFDSIESSSSSPQIQITPSPSGAPSSYLSRQNSNTSSTSSLLRAPLPGIQNVAEYSFERSNATNDPAASITSTQMSTSSMGSLPTSANLTESVVSRPPGYPITLHLNMNELVPPAKNELNFSVKGTVVVVPRTRHTTPRVNGSTKRSDAESDDTTSASGGDDREVTPVTLPRFTVLAADTESTTIVVRNDISGTSSSPASVEVYNPNGDIHSDAQARKTVLQKGGFTRCGEGGGRIVIKIPSSGYVNGHAGGRYLQAPTTTRTLNDSGRSSPIPRMSSHGNTAKYNTHKLRPKRDGELMIPWVDARITLLSSSFESSSYAVRVRLPAPAEMKGDGDWLEFGLAKSGLSGSSPSSSSTVVASDKPPDLDIVSVSVDGVPVKFEATAAAPAKEDSLAGMGFEQMSTREWINWVRIRVGGVGGGKVTIDYVVKEQESERKKGKRRADVGVPIDVYLPTFALPVGRFEALVEGQRDMKLSSLQTNFRYSVPLESSGNRLLSYAAEPFFYPRVSFFANPSPRSSSRSVSLLMVSLILGLFFFGFVGLYQAQSELAKLNRSPNDLPHLWNPVSEWDHNHFDPVTVTTTTTTTVYASQSPQSPWDWFGGGGAEDLGVTSAIITSTSSPSSDTTSTSPPVSLSPSNRAPRESKDDGDDDDLGQEILSEPSSRPFLETFGLIPYQKLMTFTWGDLKPVAESISRVASVVWKIARRVYHYPLDPP
ncbi:hypothetical protein E1B28_009204 [Marasmius oreades]|uniref:Uncharacterized protein n=1 Tax=Marasmius oreades TaxID=181124 RepID=A0A9P7USK4_9AGAR|nr:uncharacterized protein E1B28_009204 [Marasmius oreades]KAG7092897.1 hypothetical protein E1B28_009204 [Marasmius oreades]